VGEPENFWKVLSQNDTVLFDSCQ